MSAHSEINPKVGSVETKWLRAEKTGISKHNGISFCFKKWQKVQFQRDLARLLWTDAERGEQKQEKKCYNNNTVKTNNFEWLKNFDQSNDQPTIQEQQWWNVLQSPGKEVVDARLWMRHRFGLIQCGNWFFLTMCFYHKGFVVVFFLFQLEEMKVRENRLCL